MCKLITLFILWSLICYSTCFADQVQIFYDSSPMRIKRISDPEEISRIMNQTTQMRYRNQFEFQSSNLLAASVDQNENRSWMKRHPVLFGTLVGFGAGFTVGVASGGG